MYAKDRIAQVSAVIAKISRATLQRCIRRLDSRLLHTVETILQHSLLVRGLL